MNAVFAPIGGRARIGAVFDSKLTIVLECFKASLKADRPLFDWPINCHSESFLSY